VGNRLRRVGFVNGSRGVGDGRKAVEDEAKRASIQRRAIPQQQAGWSGCSQAWVISVALLSTSTPSLQGKMVAISTLMEIIVRERDKALLGELFVGADHTIIASNPCA